MSKLPLYEQLYRHVLSEIQAGRLRPGDQVPSEKELAEHFKVSRITSKKALEKLAQEGRIERARGRGSFVTATALSAPKTGLNGRPSIRPEGRVLGFLLPDFADSYGTRLLKALGNKARSLGWQVLVEQTHGRLADEQMAIERCIENGANGLIIFPVHGEFYNERILRLMIDRFPLVLVDRYLKGLPACSVFTDNRQAAFDLTEHVLKLGHKNVAFVSPPFKDTTAIEDRIQGAATATGNRGVMLELLTDLHSTLPGAFTPDNVRRDEVLIGSFLRKHPHITALIACEYNIALVIQYVLNRLGREVPRDYSLACFDSTELPVEFGPITHIRQDEILMGERAVELLDAQLTGQDVPAQTIIPHTLVPGPTTRPPRRRNH